MPQPQPRPPSTLQAQGAPGASDMPGRAPMHGAAGHPEESGRAGPMPLPAMRGTQGRDVAPGRSRLRQAQKARPRSAKAITAPDVAPRDNRDGRPVGRRRRANGGRTVRRNGAGGLMRQRAAPASRPARPPRPDVPRADRRHRPARFLRADRNRLRRARGAQPQRDGAPRCAESGRIGDPHGRGRRSPPWQRPARSRPSSRCDSPAWPAGMIRRPSWLCRGWSRSPPCRSGRRPRPSAARGLPCVVLLEQQQAMVAPRVRATMGWPIRRMMEAALGKTPTASARRFTSLFRRSIGLVRCWRGKDMWAGTSCSRRPRGRPAWVSLGAAVRTFAPVSPAWARSCWSKASRFAAATTACWPRSCAEVSAGEVAKFHLDPAPRWPPGGTAPEAMRSREILAREGLPNLRPQARQHPASELAAEA